MIARPDIDPELRASLAELPRTPTPSLELLAQMREMMRTPADAVPALDRRDVEAPGPDGASIPLSILRPTGAVPAAPCVLWIHGGGMIMGDRFSQIELPLEWLDRFSAVVVTVEYRVAPEGTTLVEDCYHGLLWVAGHADEIGIDPSRIVVAGVSGGGGLTAGVTLMARNRGAPVIAAQILICPMLDHRNATTSGATNTAGREPQAGTTEASGEADHPGRDQSSASAVIAQLKSAGAPVDSVQELTVENDPNELLGRPGQYVGKALFHDSRLPSPKDSLHPDLLDTDVGGSVEIFASPEDAERRARYVRAFTEGSGVFAEYNYLRDTIFVRVTKKLTPDQAAIYDRALGSL